MDTKMMKYSHHLWIVLAALLATIVFMIGTTRATTAAAACPATTVSGTMSNLSTQFITFTCSAPTTVYFGVCDNGSVPMDDLFTITFAGSNVASNSFSSSGESANIGQASVAAAGTHSAMLTSTNAGTAPPATYSYIISSTRSDVESGLSSVCGTDFVGMPGLGNCVRNVPVFTTDTAPTDGTLIFNVLFGEKNRQEGITTRTWELKEGQRVNNDGALLPAPNWARVWWQPDGENTWYLLTSQYWQGDGTYLSEYGLSCDSGEIPSYHTSFESMIPESSVPLFKH